MGYLTKFGTAWGNVPETSGNVFFVAPSSSATISGNSVPASDNADGLSPERPLATIAQAISNATANASDVIALLPGTHTSASNVAVSKAGLTFVGLHPVSRFGPDIKKYPLASKVNWTSTFAGNAVTVTAADTTFVGINVIPLTARAFCGFSAAATRMAVIDCSTTLSAVASTSTKGWVASGAADSVAFTNHFTLNSIGAQGPAFDLTGCTNFLLQSPRYACTTGSWAVGVQFGAGAQGIVDDGRMFCSGTAITIGYDGTGVAANKAIFMSNNLYGVSPGAGACKNFTNAFCELVNNWYATIGAGAGFVIQTIVV